LAGKVAIVAGAARGIGAASATRLAEEGAKVLLADLDGPAAEQTAGRIRSAGGDAIAFQFDIREPESVRALVTRCLDVFGTINLLHNNAADMSGQTLGQDRDLVSTELSVWDRTFRTNLFGFVHTMRAVLPVMVERRMGSIVNTSSGSALGGQTDLVAYACSKAAINALTRHVASRWGSEGIRCNAVMPGQVPDPETVKATSIADLEQMTARTRLGRLGKPDDIASVVAFLMSDDADWITGQAWSVAGGAMLRE